MRAAVLAAVLLSALAAPSGATGPYEQEALRAQSDEELLYRRHPADEMLDEALPPKPSVNLSEEYGFGSGKQNIDSFLGEYENPFASPEATYEGSRSELRNDPERDHW